MPVATATRPFEALLADFLDYLERDRGLARNTLEAYRCDLRQLDRYLRRTGGSLAAADLAGFLGELAAGGGRARPASPATLQRKVACLRSFYRHLRRQGVLPDDPAAALQAPRGARRPPHVLTRDEVRRLLAQPVGGGPASLRDRALLALMYASGLRASELIAVELGDLDRPRGRLRVGQQRTLRLRRPVLSAIAAYVERGRPSLVGDRAEPSLFVNHRGGRLTRQGLYKIVQRHAAGAGLAERMSPHTLRHTCAAHALADGGDVRSLQALLGHADIATTRLYRQLLP